MTRSRPPAYKGSEKWLQVAVNDSQQGLNCAISSRLCQEPPNIEWLSPLRGDSFTEYSGRRFIERLGLVLKNRPLNSFWPRRGPEWDALAKTDSGHVLLVEAKSHVAELKGPESSDTSKKSVDRITDSLRETQHFLGANDSVDWFVSPYYQYANRLAHLFLLRVLNGLPAHLVMLYFLNDQEQGGPSSVAEWLGPITEEEEALGLGQSHSLSDYVMHVYIDVNDIEASR